MNSIKMERVKLLEIVRENKEKHIAAYNESVEDYKAAVLKIAKRNHFLAKTGDLNQIGQMKKFPNHPVSYEDNYTKAIRMLELSVEDVIDIEEHIFNQLVLDEWGWKQQFVATGALYKSI